MAPVEQTHFDFYCVNRACEKRGWLLNAPRRDCGDPRCCPWGGTHYPFCPACGRVMRENAQAPGVVWTGSIGQRYRSKAADGYHEPDGMTMWSRKTPDGKPVPVRLESWADVRRFAKSEGLTDPRELPNNLEVKPDGKSLANTMGMPGSEV